MESQFRALHSTAQANLAMVADRLGRPLSGDIPRHRPGIVPGCRRPFDGIPYAVALAVIDAEGDPVLTADPSEVFSVNARGRDYFTKAVEAGGRLGDERRADRRRRPRPDDGGQPRAARPVRSRSGGWRRWRLKTDYFVDFYRDLDADSGSLFTAVRLDGGLVARYPQPEASFTRFDTSRHPFTRFAEGPTGIYRAPSVGRRHRTADRLPHPARSGHGGDRQRAGGFGVPRMGSTHPAQRGAVRRRHGACCWCWRR